MAKPCAERMIGTLRRECLDNIIVFNERQLARVLQEYLDYYHRYRPHWALDRDAPIPRAVEAVGEGEVIELPMVGGLYHRYTRRAA